MGNTNIYAIQSGDCAWSTASKILKAKNKEITNADIMRYMKSLAKANGCKNIDEFNKKYFNGRTKNINVAPPTIENYADLNDYAQVKSVTREWKDIKAEQDKINQLPSDKQKVIEWNKLHPGTTNFVIIDKKNCSATVYSTKGKELKSFEIGIGRQKGDDYLKPNNVRPMTSAGIYHITAKGTGKDGYARLYNDKIFTMATDKGETGVALHKIPNGNKIRQHLNYNGNLKDNRYSNGCINFTEKDFKFLEKYVGKNSSVYILPEDKNNYIQVKNQQLNLTQHKYTGQVKTSKASQECKSVSFIPKDTNLPEAGKNFAKTLSTQKANLMKELRIDNDTYNDIAQLSLGIAKQESNYGNSQKYKFKENHQDIVSFLKSCIGNHSSASRGLTQIKIKEYTDKNTLALLKKYNITAENLNNPQKSATATVIVLANMYKNELPALKSKMTKLNLSYTDALLYLWNGKKNEIIEGTATPQHNKYIKNVSLYAQAFNLKQKEDIISPINTNNSNLLALNSKQLVKIA